MCIRPSPSDQGTCKCVLYVEANPALLERVLVEHGERIKVKDIEHLILVLSFSFSLAPFRKHAV
jgi:hypothetical protein